MSELMNTQNAEQRIRWDLLTTVSAAALLASVGTHGAMAADQDADHPTVWIELGAQLEHVEGEGEPFTPAFLTKYANSSVLRPTTPLEAQNPPPGSFGEEGKISVQPNGSDWVFSAAVRYGRSNNSRHVDQQTHGAFHSVYKYGVPQGSASYKEKFADMHISHHESHAILDFTAGKDIGLGVFGLSGSSVLNAGVRFAQFTSTAAFDIRARPDLQFKYHTLGSYGYPGAKLKMPYFHTYHAMGQASRSFRGVGPSISWNSSARALGHPEDGEVTFDWGANAAILFGRQKARVQHQESGHYQAAICFVACATRYAVVYQNPPRGHVSDRSVIVPDVGGFAGASYRIENFKVSAGYRADFFFGATDGGIDARKSETLGFYGPFATISAGLP